MRWWVIALAGCYGPSFQPNVPCSAALTCPGDQVCDTAQSPPTCVTQLGAPDGGAGTPDGNTVSACGVCPAAMPVCDMDTTTCRGCQQDDDCDSHVCSESTGMCLTQAQTLYVRTTGDDSNPCSHDQPCAHVSHAVQLLDATHNVIRIFDGDYSDAIVSSNVSFLLSGEFIPGSNATIHFKPTQGRDHVLEVDGGTVLVEGLSFEGGTAETIRVQGNATFGMYVTEVYDSPIGGIDAQGSTVNLYNIQVHDNMGAEAAINLNGGSLTLSRGAIYNNANACVRVSGAKYDVENTFMIGCGAEGFGQLGTVVAGSLFTFNTVAENNVGAACTNPIVVRNSIFAGNTMGPQIPMCASAAYSLTTDSVAAPGTGNIVGDPSFAASDDFHINFNSAARDKGDPASTEMIDYDGDARPHGAGYDIGADEHY